MERQIKYIVYKLHKCSIPEIQWKGIYPHVEAYWHAIAVYMATHYNGDITRILDLFVGCVGAIEVVSSSLSELFECVERPKSKRIKVEHELEAITRSKIVLFDFQKEAVHHILKQRGTCLCYDTGNGKSLVAVTATQQMLIDNPFVRIVVIAPLSLLSNFQLSLERYGAGRDHPSYDYYTYEGFANAYKKNPDLLINCVVVFDEVHHIRTDVHTALRTKHKAYVGKLRTPGRELIEHEQRYLQYEKTIKTALKEASKRDECDPIAHVAEKTGGVNSTCIAPRSLLAINAVHEAFKVICLTATPFFNSSYDIVPLICMMRGEHVYSKRYFSCITSSPQLFEAKCRGLFLFQNIDKHDKDFPRVNTHKMDLVMTPGYYEAYHEIENEIESKTSALNLDSPWVFLSGLRRATMSLEEAVKPKFAIDVASQGYKTIIFSVFKSHGIHLVAKGLRDKNIPFVEITGDVSEEMRETCVQRFNATSEELSDAVNVVLITSAGGEGLDFRGVRKMVCLEMEWNEAQLKQAIGRAPRRKSHHHLSIHERIVDVYLLCLVKPVSRAADDHILESADQMLRRHTLKKLKEIEPIERMLRNLSK